MTDEIRVLYVEDDTEYAAVTTTYLERGVDSLEIVIESSANEGLRRLETTDFDCIVSDFRMPGTNGLELFEVVREDYPDIPFILFTGSDIKEISDDGIPASLTDYIQKGSSSQYARLATRVVDAVDHYRATRRSR